MKQDGDIDVAELAKFEIKDALQRRRSTSSIKVSITVPSGIVPDWDFSYTVVCERYSYSSTRNTNLFLVEAQGPWFKPLGALKCNICPPITTYAVAEWADGDEPTWFTSPDLDLVPWLDECLPAGASKVPLAQDEIDFVSAHGFAKMLISMPREE